MNRRAVLRASGFACVAAAVGVAGCLERLGFEEQSAWRDPPLVEDRPDAVYLPASVEEMGHFGSASDGDYGVALSYTFPHRFWNVRGRQVDPVEVRTDDSLHVMCDAWDVETGTVLPVDMFVEILRDGDTVEAFSPWPMLSQRMGFHYGDNVELPEEGTYTARIDVGPVDARRVGAFDGRFETAGRLDVEFTYDRSDVLDLDFELLPYDTRGTRDALELLEHGTDHAPGGGGNDHGSTDDDDRDHAGHDAEDPTNGHDGGHPPTSRARAVEELPGRHLGTVRSADADFVVQAVEDGSLAGDADRYLAVSPRTPYNRILLPLISLSATVSRDDATVLETPLRETLHEELGHHYGAGIVELVAGDEVTIHVESPPQVTRHDGYETAFLDFEDVTVQR